MKQLATELTDFIIDHLHSDRQSLSVCSLVCRKWLPASRFHLFGTVRVKWFNVHSFVELLGAPSSTIPTHVHTLHIYLQSHLVMYRRNLDFAPCLDVIAPYFEKFIAIKSISLQGRRWIPFIEGSLSSRGLGEIRNMDIESVYYNFSGNWFILTFTLGDSGPFSFLSRLRVLRSVLDDGPIPWSWLPIVAQFPAVNHVTLNSIGELHLPTVQAMLKSGGLSIHTIELTFSVDQSSIGTSEYLTAISTPSFTTDL
jgi:hypothetical protein